MLERAQKTECETVFHLPGLNGLRAIAALAVVFAHTTAGLKEFGLNPYIFGINKDGYPKSTHLAGFGVSLFFALSGFLITYLLLLEKRRSKIAIGKFYIRRVLRIWPLYFTYLLVAILVAVTLLNQDIRHSYRWLPFYALILPNIPHILGGGFPLLAHYWSLGVEEQYYAIWPWLVRHSWPLRAFCVWAIVLLISLKTLVRFGLGDTSTAYKFLNVTRFQCMLIGALGAVLFEERHALFLRFTSHKAIQAAAWMVIALAAVNHFHIASFLDHEIISLVTVVLIIGQVAPDRKPLVNLDKPLMDFIGQISYGIYVIHPLIIFFTARIMHDALIDHPAFKYPLAYAIVLGATLGIAFISYTHFERPFLALKERYATVRSSGSILAFLSARER